MIAQPPKTSKQIEDSAASSCTRCASQCFQTNWGGVGRDFGNVFPDVHCLAEVVLGILAHLTTQMTAFLCVVSLALRLLAMVPKLGIEAEAVKSLEIVFARVRPEPPLANNPIGASPD